MPSEHGEPLSDRELDVVRQLSLGAVNREIAAELSISPNTVKVHLRNIYAKLGVTTRTEAVAVALQQGLILAPGHGPAAESQDEGSLTPVNVATPAGEAAGKKASARSPAWRNWRLIAILATLLALTLLLVIWLGDRARENASTAETFVELPIGDSSWRRSRPLPAPITRMAVASNGLTIYHIGGEQEGAVSDQVLAYDTGSYAWRSLTPKPTAVADATAAVLFGEIYVPGGRRPNGRPTSIVEAYSPANDAWRPIAALPRPLAGALALSDGSSLYLFGGWDGQGYVADSFVYDPGNDSWRPLAPLPQPRAYAAGGFVADRLYVIGGYDGEQDLAHCHWYDRAEDSWHKCPDTLEPRAAAGAAVIFNRLYIIGGGWHDEVAFSEFLDTANETWQVTNDPILTNSKRWSHLGVTNVERRIYAMGGELDTGFSTDNLVFIPFPYESFIPASSSGD